MIGAILDTDVFSIIIDERPQAQIARHGLLMPTDGVLRLWGVLRAQAGRLGHPLGRQAHSNDLWIAACAVFYRVPLVTGNGRHFVGLPGLEVVG